MWSFNDFKNDPNGISMFIAVSEGGMETAFGPVRALFTCFEMAVKRPGQPATGHKILVHIDEAGSLKRLDTVETGMAALASAGCRINLLVQSTAMLKKHYGEHGFHALMSGVTVRVWLDLRDLDSLETAKKFAGEKEVIANNRSFSLSEADQESETEGGSRQDTRTHSDNENTTDGTHKSVGDTFSKTRNDSFNGSLITWMASGIIPRFMKKWWSVSFGTTFGTSGTSGNNHAVSKGTSDATAVAVGSQKSGTKGSTSTATGTITENRQVRPTLSINELKDRYSINSWENDRLALIEICGIGLFETERTFFFEHPQWYGQFGKDPEHPFVQAPKPAHVLEQEAAEAERSPAAIAAARHEIAAHELQEDYSILTFGMKWVFAGGGLLFPLVGVPLLSLPMAAGYFACRRVERDQHTKQLRIDRLKATVLKSVMKE